MFNLSEIPIQKYDKNKVNVLILKIKKCSCEKREAEFKMKLFVMMSRVIVKNIHNYLKLSANSPIKEDSNNFIEMQSEAFIILDKCILNFKISIDSDFYFYFNKSLSRNFFRFFSQHIRERKRGDSVSEFIKIFGKTYTSDMGDDVNFLMHQLGFSKDEIVILNSKMFGQSKSDFLSKTKMYNSESYNNHMATIKEKLTKLKEENGY